MVAGGVLGKGVLNTLPAAASTIAGSIKKQISNR
jgi:hypothetical protein